MRGFLVNIETGESHELDAMSILGRSAECNVLIQDPRVSRRHAMIRKQADGFWYYDLGSFNGSYLNGSRVTTTRRLARGDVLDLSEHEFRFELEGDVFDPSETELGGSTIALIRSTPVIIFVSDVEGFTTMSEKLPPDDLAMVIGGWYAECERILAGHGATVDKFSGDSVLAYWTDIAPSRRQAAIEAARDLEEACLSIHESKRDLFDQLQIQFGAGAALHIGKVAYGGMSQGETTLLGDPVNLTFRLEGLTRQLGVSTLASKEFLEGWPEGQRLCRGLGSHQVKGRAQPVEVFAVEKG